MYESGLTADHWMIQIGSVHIKTSYMATLLFLREQFRYIPGPIPWTMGIETGGSGCLFPIWRDL